MNEKELDEFLEQERLEALLDTYENDERCPICHSWDIGIEGRCITCFVCGWSKCEI